MNVAARITGTGSAFPRRVVTNADIVDKLAAEGISTSDEWIRTRTGIEERHMVTPSYAPEHNSSLGLAAACQALEMAGKAVSEIDLILYATCTPDTLIPSTACWLQHKLGATQAWGMDLNAACSGFLYSLVTAEQFILSGRAQTILVVGAEVLSPFLNWEDRSSCILFGDAAGAAIVERTSATDPRRILASRMLSDGSLWELLYIPAGGSRLPADAATDHPQSTRIHMNGREIFKVAVRTLTRFAQQVLADCNFELADLDWFIPHQANRRIIEAVAERLKLPPEKILINLDRYGNTSSATVPTALDEALRDGRIQPGQLLLLDTFGAGLTYGAVLLRW